MNAWVECILVLGERLESQDLCNAEGRGKGKMELKLSSSPRIDFIFGHALAMSSCILPSEVALLFSPSLVDGRVRRV